MLVGLANNGFVGGGAAAGVVGQGRAIANDNAALGGEFVASDVLNAGFTNIEILGTTTVTRTFNGSGNTIYEILDGRQQTAFFTNQPSFFWNGAPNSPIGNAIDCNTANSNQWNSCFTGQDGGANTFAWVGTQSAASGASDGQLITGHARASGTTDSTAAIQFVHAAPSGSCPSAPRLDINVAGSTNSTILYVCSPGNTWSAVTVP